MRTAAGEKTRLWEQAQLAAHERQADAARARTKQRHDEDAPEIEMRNEEIQEKAQRFLLMDWTKSEILDTLEGDGYNLKWDTLARIAFGDT